jgi:pectin methylesterase-like acyl-CoA thioesterase
MPSGGRYSRIAGGLVLCLWSWVAASDASAVDLYVDPSAAIAGSFASVQSAIDAAPAGSAGNRTVIRIQPGTYTEKLTVPSNKPFLTLLGTTPHAADTVLTFNLNANSPNGSGGTVGTTGSTSTTINGDHFIAANLTFANSTPDNISQAVALKTNSDCNLFQNVRFVGFQDTLYLDGGAGAPRRNYVVDSYVTGDTDFIFGRATAVFENSTINSSDRQYITAPRTEAANPYGFVFLNSTLTKQPNPVGSTVTSVPNNSTYLGRPWQYDSTNPVVQAKSVFINTKMGPHVITAGWNPWDAGNTHPEQTTYFAEYNSMDLAGNPLNVAGRVPWSHQLTPAEAANYTLANIFGNWDYASALASIPPVPEPTTAMLAVTMLIALLSRRRRAR